jgi:phenylalanine-4-hydroxylase
MNEVLNANQIPHFEQLDQWFKHSTEWQIHVVPGLIPVEDFFGLLAQKRFCSSTWLRSKQNLDYLEEPDMFHDIFGHVPLLSNPIFSKFMVEFGQLGWECRFDKSFVEQLERLYWFTIEFGVIQEDKVRSYGAGILSSFGETNHVDSNMVEIKPYDLEEILHTSFHTDTIQSTYFCIESVQQLVESLNSLKKRTLVHYELGNQ